MAQETIKKLKIPGLYVISSKVSSFRYCELRSEKHGLIIKYSSQPIEKITDFIKLFEECLSHLDWTVEECTNEHLNAVIKMQKRITTNELARFVVSE